MTDLSTYDILNDIRNGKTPVKRQNPQPGESPYYYIQSNGDKSYLPITEKNIINVNSAEEPNPLWSSAFQKTTNTGSNEATQTSVADSVLSGTFDTFQTDGLGTNSTQTDNWGFNSVSSTNNTMSLFDTPQTISSILGTSSSGSANPFGTSSFQPDNSSFSNTINNYFTPNMSTEQSYLDTTAQTQNTIDINTNLKTKENYSNAYPIMRPDKRKLVHFPLTEYVKYTTGKFDSPHPNNQIFGALRDFGESYINMQNANLRSNPETRESGKTMDNYVHCIANYNAAKRGSLGGGTGLLLGVSREMMDLIKNTKKGDIYSALKDAVNDLSVNSVGILKGMTNWHQSAEEACQDYKPESYNPIDVYKWYRK
ncbi:MAG: hypothetical protein E7014_03210 [Alphaproteobacteria bacterium]|nr:hypothetical protein [Alphaproteobacteria bacterium]